MSAIWGMIDFNGESDNEYLAGQMEAPYHSYCIDTFRKYIAKDAVFGYGGQYFTKESEKELLPIVSDDNNQIFSADVVLDNREELFKMLGICKNEQSNIPDGTLMYQILRRFDKDCFNLLLGTYAFVYYDRIKKEAILVTDSVGSRSLYYCHDQGKVYFSTAIKPILTARNVKPEWNYRFLSDYLALNNLALYTEAEETPYKNIYKVAPGQAVVIKENEIVNLDYWKPVIYKKMRRKSDEEIKNEFIRLFDTCVADVMRSSGKTGILLSGGLDSTSVACFAAPKLNRKNEMLFSYTSIPEKDYSPQIDQYFIPDEQKMVEYTRNYLGNLSCAFLDLPGKNGFDNASDYMKELEIPYKSLQNIQWLHACSQKAAMDGCRILLTGKFGNATISFGSYEKQFYSLFRRCRFIELAREINAYAQNYNVGRKRTLKYLKEIIKSNLFRKKPEIKDRLQNVYVNPQLLKQFNTEKRLKLHSQNLRNCQTLAGRVRRPEVAYRPMLIQMGEFETHLSLVTGVLQRDPTRDRRIIEFCFNLNDRQFVYRGVERRLVREYLAGFLPQEIIMEIKHRGLQSADMIERFSKNWNHIYQTCNEIIKDDMAARLLDTAKIKKKLEIYKEKLTPNEEFEILKLLYSILLVRYVK